MQRKLVKSRTSFEAFQKNEDKQSVHETFVARKVYKPDESLRRKTRLWVFKPNKISESVIVERVADLKESILEASKTDPNLQKQLEKNKDQFDQMCHDAIVKQFTDPLTVWIDVIISEYYSFISGKPYKARVVTDDKQEKVLGKSMMCIPGLKSLNNKINHSVEDKKNSPSVSLIFRTLIKSDNPKATLASFAQACVFSQRFDDEDMRLHNIGIEENGTVVLFDHDGALSQVREHQDEFNLNKSLARVNYSNILQQPSNSLKFLKDIPDKTIQEEFQRVAGDENYNFFHRQVFRSLLKELLCPNNFILTLIDEHTVNSLQNQIKRVRYFIIKSKQKLKAQLLDAPAFVEYLLKHSANDFKLIQNEFESARLLHPHYFKINPKLNEIFSFQIESEYKNLIEQADKQNIHNRLMYSFHLFANVQPVPSAPAPKMDDHEVYFHAEDETEQVINFHEEDGLTHSMRAR